MRYFTSYLKKVILLRNSRYPPDTGLEKQYSLFKYPCMTIFSLYFNFKKFNFHLRC